MRNPIDVAIRWVAPGIALGRARARWALAQADEARAAFDAAKVDREWTTVGASGTAEQVNGPERQTLMLRARALERNSDMLQSLVGGLVRNVVGTGIRPQARIRTKKGTYNDVLNERLELLWSQWVKTCDITGTHTFYELQNLALWRKFVDGESLVRMVTDASARIPLKLQTLEADAVYSQSTMSGGSGTGKTVVNGVEVDEFYRPLAYLFAQANPDGWSVKEPVRVPASEVIHLFHKSRTTQLRGTSELAPAIRLIRDTGEFLDADLLKAKIQSCFALVVTSPDAQMLPQPGSKAAVSSLTDMNGKPVNFIERGAIHRLSPGSKVETITGGAAAGSTAKDFAELETRRAGASMGVSYEIASRDMSKSTYSSARASHLEDRKTFEFHQQYLIDHLCMPIWREFVKACRLAGLVAIPGDWTDSDLYEAVEWVAPGWDWIDPLKDVKATQEELKSNIKTFSQVCAERGLDWREQIQQRARERAFAKEQGVPLDAEMALEMAGAKAKPSKDDPPPDLLQYHVENGIVTKNEVRANRGLATVVGGDVYLLKPGLALTESIAEAPPTAPDTGGGGNADGSASEPANGPDEAASA